MLANQLAIKYAQAIFELAAEKQLLGPQHERLIIVVDSLVSAAELIVVLVLLSQYYRQFFSDDLPRLSLRVYRQI